MAPSKSAVFFKPEDEVEDESVSNKNTYENEAYKGHLGVMFGNRAKSRESLPIRYRVQQSQMETR